MEETQVVVPADPEYALEPARTIGQMFADKAMVKTFVAAFVGIVSMVLKVTIDDTMVDNVTTVITLGSIMVAGVVAQLEARTRSLQQAEATRKVVYAPQTVADEVAKAVSASGGRVDAVVVDAPLQE